MGETDLCVLVKEVEVCTACVCKFFAVVDRLTASADAIRWNQAEELSTFDYFDINALLAYLVKVNIVARWTRLDDKQGREMLHRLMTSLDGKDLINKQ